MEVNYYYIKSGYVTSNDIKIKDTVKNDPYFRVNKTNHIINYRGEIPGYQGHKPIDPVNFKITRPYCLTTKRD